MLSKVEQISVKIIFAFSTILRKGCASVKVVLQKIREHFLNIPGTQDKVRINFLRCI